MTNLPAGKYFVGVEGDYTFHAIYPGYKEVSVQVKLEATSIKTVGSKIPPLCIRLESNK